MAAPSLYSFDIRQIAAALNVEKRSAERRAVRSGWPFHDVAGRGGRRRLYPLHDLPACVQSALLLAFPAPAEDIAAATARELRQKSPVLSSAQLQAAWSRYELVSTRQKEEAMRRLAALQAVDKLVDNGTPVTDARALVADQLVRAGMKSGSVVALWRWSKRCAGAPRDAWLALLVPEYTGRTATVEIPAEAWDLFKADFLRPESPAASACYDRLRRIARAKGWQLPSLRTFERRLEREVPRQAKVLARDGAEALMRMFPAQERDKGVFSALEAVNADGHRFDVFVKFPCGTVARPIMVAFQDIFSARLLSWRVGQTESSDLARLAFGDMVNTYGIPSHALLDNGRGFAAKFLTGGTPTRYRFKVREEDPVGIFTAMNVQVHWATPYHGQAKPIERAFRDLCETVAKHPRFSGAYTGNSPMAKPENYGSRAVPLDVFLAVLKDEIQAHNAREGRRSKVCAGRSFDQVFAESYASATIRRATAEQRRLWMLAADGVMASNTDGSVRLLGNRYWTESLARHAGQKVVVRFDPDNLHTSVHAYTLSGGYIGEAECIASVGFADVGAGREHARARRQWRRAARDMLDAERRMDASQVADQMPGGVLPDMPSPGVIQPMFPRRDPAPAAAALAKTGTDDDAALERDRALNAYLMRVESNRPL